MSAYRFPTIKADRNALKAPFSHETLFLAISICFCYDIAKNMWSKSLTEVLYELELSGFIRIYAPYGKRSRGSLYQLVDFFTLFYFNFMKDSEMNNESFWIDIQGSGKQHAWSGYAFEQVCQWHIRQVKRALGIEGVAASIWSWRSTTSDPGAQIDLIIDRSDGIINLCEIKYTNSEYNITKEYDHKLRDRAAAFARETKTKKAVHQTFITVYGLARNEYAYNVQSEVTAETLFVFTR